MKLNLDWIIDNKTVPSEVTKALQMIADKHHLSVDMMHQQKARIIEELHSMEKSYLVKFLFLNGINDDERWLHALIRMEIRRLEELTHSEIQRK
jgi:hypothetical protein